jgi:hypothetical protein
VANGERVIPQWLKKEDSSLPWRVEPRQESTKPASVTDKHEETDRRPVVCTEGEPNSRACSPPDRVSQNRSTNPPTPRRETSQGVSERAQRLLRAHLASGPRRGELIEAAAEAAGIPESSLIKAADVLGVRTQRGQWWLPG